MFQRAIPVTRKHSFKRVKPKGLLCQDQLQFTFQKKKKKPNKIRKRQEYLYEPFLKCSDSLSEMNFWHCWHNCISEVVYAHTHPHVYVTYQK